jgi:methanogenic corrinoid protein MtbC1
VARLQPAHPDVTHSSLRFLEREGLIASSRTPGGHRLYSEAVIDRIDRIKTWQRQGMSLESIRLRLAEYDALPSPQEISARFLRQVLQRDLDAATRTILAADDAGLPLAVTFNDVLRPALVQVGHKWESGELLVAQEKEISEISRDLVAELTLRHHQIDARGPLVLAGCVEGERHELGLRMIAGLLRAESFQIRYLGADVATRFLLDAARMRRPAAILLSVTLESNLHGVRDAVETLRAGLAPEPLPPIVCGGQMAAVHPGLIGSWGAIPVTDGDAVEVVRTVTGDGSGAAAG